MRRTTRLGRYHLTDRIAFGGMAEVFRGFTFGEDGHRYDVAIKRLLPHYVEDKQFVTMLTDEYRLVSRLHHHNITQVFELVDVGNSLLIAMEYVDGKDLRSTIDKARKQDQKLHYADIAYVMAHALDGLHHAHTATDESGDALNVVHRDFSPSNLLLSYDGEVKIIDFGIAKATQNRIQTKTGVIKGKVKYMSPEQAFGHPLDCRSDVFSAGSVLYELCTGRPPFRARSEIDLIFEVRDATPMPCRDVVGSIPLPLAEIIACSMAREKTQRYPTALAFRDALVRFLKNFAPDYRRTRLARFMKRVWNDEIDVELRTLEEYAVDLTPSDGHLGRNLIADTLGPDAAYAKFSPRPSSPGERRPDRPMRKTAEVTPGTRQSSIPAAPASPAPKVKTSKDPRPTTPMARPKPSVPSLPPPPPGSMPAAGSLPEPSPKPPTGGATRRIANPDGTDKR